MDSKPAADPAPLRSPRTPALHTGLPRRILWGVGRTVGVLVLLYIFLFAIALLGAAFKVFGAGFSRSLIATTAQPVLGVIIGLLSTSLIQSSSSTTSIVVGLVAAGALTVRGAIPIIMGANLGTTVTNTIVALTTLNRRAEFKRAFAGATMHDFFNLLTILILFPLEMATHYLERVASWLARHLVATEGIEFQSPIKLAVKPAVSAAERLLSGHLFQADWLAGSAMLALSLVCIVFALAGLTRQLRRAVLTRAEGSLSTALTRSGPAAMLIGLLITAAVQSSSVTTSLLVPMIGAGIVPLEAGFATTLGANVGTTVTALLASLAGNLGSVTVALVHLLFNVTGILIIYPYRPIRRIPVRLAQILADRSAAHRYFAFLYIMGFFFLMPLAFILLSKVL
jgi:sodium-dependent phosphate cotransporter